MLKQLYEKFQNWSDGGSLYIYSDPHFVGNGNVDSDEVQMRKVFHYGSDELQISNINNKVSKNDTLIILGDVGDPIVLEQLKCKNLILIKGNHDRGNEYYKDRFREIYEGPLFINEKILLSHEPIYSENWLNIHGHIHNQSQLDKAKEEKNFICVSANLHNYEPMNLGHLFKHEGEFKDFKSFKDIPSIHRATIDLAIERKRKRKLGEFTTF